MDTEKKRRLEWERRLPEINAPWTHWRLLADGKPVADISGDDILGALAVIEHNAETFRLIVAKRVAYDSAGSLTLEDKGLFEIYHRSRFGNR